MNLLLVEVGGAYYSDLIKKLEGKGLRVSHFTSAKNQAFLDSVDVDSHQKKSIDVRHLYDIKKIRKYYGDYCILLTFDIIDFFTFIERDFFILTDRANFHSICVRERKRLYFELIRFWIGYLKTENIDAVYFPYTPHSPGELVLMQAAKYLKIPYCILSHTAINNRSIFRTCYRTLEKVPEEYLKDKTSDEIISSVHVDLYDDYTAESIVTSVVKLQNDLFQKQVGINANTEKYNEFYKKELKRKSFGKHINKLKDVVKSTLIYLSGSEKTFRFATAMDKTHRFLGWERSVAKHRRYANQLKAKYESLTEDIDLDQAYIYFPLHLQPELTSQPEAGYFEDQYLALETLLQALPEDTFVYVKENPRQFDININTLSAMHFRDTYDYDLFTKDPRVKFVPQSIKSEELIEKAQITVTLTGTAGWEALELGKPCITFGSPWYSPCPSCFVVKTPADIKSALIRAKRKTKDMVKDDVLRYLSYYQDRLVISTLHDPTNVSYNSIPYDVLVDSHAQALADLFKARLSNHEIKKKSS